MFAVCVGCGGYSGALSSIVGTQNDGNARENAIIKDLRR